VIVKYVMIVLRMKLINNAQQRRNFLVSFDEYQ
jgi:hypothetical protein